MTSNRRPSAGPGCRIDDPYCENERNTKSEISLTGQTPTKQLAWEIGSISIFLEEIHQIWASALEVSHPQLKILMALSKDDGVAVNVVAKMLHVEPSFVTTQSKVLEKKGLLYRSRCSSDRRVVQLSLCEPTHQQVGNLAAQQLYLDDFIFKDYASEERSNFMTMLATLKVRIERARHRAALDCLVAALPSRSC